MVDLSNISPATIVGKSLAKRHTELQCAEQEFAWKKGRADRLQWAQWEAGPRHGPPPPEPPMRDAVGGVGATAWAKQE